MLHLHSREVAAQGMTRTEFRVLRRQECRPTQRTPKANLRSRIAMASAAWRTHFFGEGLLCIAGAESAAQSFPSQIADVIPVPSLMV